MRASGMCLGNSDPGGIPSPDTPTPPGAQSLQAENPEPEPLGVLFCVSQCFNGYFERLLLSGNRSQVSETPRIIPTSDTSSPFSIL